jgi:hypothetical protein
MTPRHDRFVAASGRTFARGDGVSLRLVSPAALYDDWRLAETEASLAMAAWYATPRSDKAAAYARYAVRTDAEEAAATKLAERLGRAA